MLSRFPKFEKLTIENKEEIEKITNKFPPYSDYNFTSMFGYDTEGILELSLLHNNLVIMFTDYVINKPFFSFIGNNQPLETATILLNEASKKNILPYLKLIPEVNITEEIKSNRSLSIEEDRDNFDYILSIKDIATLSNKHYNKKKQFMTFVRTYPNRSILELNFQNKQVREQLISLFNKWKKDKEKTDEETITELTAIKKTIENSTYLRLVGLGLYIDNQLIGFSIADLEHDGYAQFHFVKGNMSYKGIFATLYVYLAQFLYKNGYKYMNIEQDLGISGLREAKEQWHPVKFLKKYTIKRRENSRLSVSL